MPTFPPASPVLNGELLTASVFLQQPEFVARRLRELADLRYVGAQLLKGRMNTIGGAVGYEVAGESIFADGTLVPVAPGAEYELTTSGLGNYALAKVLKLGRDQRVTDEDIKRRNLDSVERALLKLANSAALVIDQAVSAAIASAVTQSIAAATKWTAGSTTVLQEILLGQAAIGGQNQGYNPDTLLVSDTLWAYLASNQQLATLLRREDPDNPVYSGRFDTISGLTIVHVPDSHLPGADGTSAWVLDSTLLGFIASEQLGGGYEPAGELVETKVMREDDMDSWRVRARVNFAAGVTDPLAAVKITGVA